MAYLGEVASISPIEMGDMGKPVSGIAIQCIQHCKPGQLRWPVGEARQAEFDAGAHGDALESPGMATLQAKEKAPERRLVGR